MSIIENKNHNDNNNPSSRSKYINKDTNFYSRNKIINHYNDR